MVKHLLKEKAPRVGRRLIEALGVNGQFPLRPLPSRGEMPFSATYDGRRPFAHKIAYEGQRRPRLNATCGARRSVDGAAYPPDGLIYVTPAPYCPVPGMSDNDPSRPSSTKAHKVRPLFGHIDQKTAPFDLCVNMPLGGVGNAGTGVMPTGCRRVGRRDTPQLPLDNNNDYRPM